MRPPSAPRSLVVPIAFAVSAIVTACSGSTTPPPQALGFSNFVYPTVLLWLPLSSGAPGGVNADAGNAIMTTIPFSGAGRSDIGALQNRVGFYLVAAPSAQQLTQLQSQSLTWSASNNVASLAAAPDITPPPLASGPTLQSEYVSGGTVAGIGTLTASINNAPVAITSSVQVFTYRVVDVGCTDAAALAGASFSTNGSYTANPNGGGDLFITGPACTQNFFGNGSTYAINTPYGGTLVSAGEVAQFGGGYLGNENASNFTNIPATVWKSDFTTLDAATFQADFNPPCVQIQTTPIPLPSGVPNPAPTISGCTANPLDVLVFKTRTGAIVKMYLALSNDTTTSASNLTGAYEVTDASGNFPY